MNPLEQAFISQAAKASDTLQAPALQEGYVAERHGLQKDLVIIWASCGCYWVGGPGGSFVTACMKDSCDFSYPETERALEALRRAEEHLNSTQEDLHVVPAGPTGPAQLLEVPETTTQGSTPETTPPQEGRTAVDALIDAMISEGGPVDPSL